jgi:tRNA-binding protein
MNPLDAFAVLDLRVGRVVRAEPSAGAKKPAFRLWIDFGSQGVRTSSAQLTHHYSSDLLVGRLVIAVVNLGTRRINGFLSEVLVLGLPDDDGQVVLLAPERDVPLGGRVF